MNSNLKRLKVCLLVIFVALFVGISRSAASRVENGALVASLPNADYGYDEQQHTKMVEQSAPKIEKSGDKISAAAAATDEAAKEASKATSNPGTANAVPGPSPGPDGWSFRNHVQPVLTKYGCNSGACHGSSAGKNGFKLTLRGYDPDTDHAVLTRQAAARRVSIVEPAKSLLLLKPTMIIAHGGGKRFDTNSLEYRVLSEWIAAGAPPPAENDSIIQTLEITPRSRTLAPSGQQQLKVSATFSDGRTEDVTRWAKYTSSDEGIASVTETGHVKMLSHGESTISVWYLSRVASARVSVPYPNKIDAVAFARMERRNFIDDLVQKKLKTLNISPSGPATEGEFLRRAFLDATGTLPTVDEVRTFLADTAPDKRTKLIDKLLERSEYVDYWTYKWSDLLLASSNKLQRKTLLSFSDWIRESVRQNKPWNEFVRELITASGNSQENGAVSYYVIHKSPIDRAENMTAAFMGIRMTCARCHNHPLEKWTQKQYYGFANLFTRVKLKNGAAPGDVSVYTSPTGDINHPRLGRPVAPRPLDGEELSYDSTKDRRVHFAEWLTSPKNPHFARMLVNRVWKNFMGRGLVDPVDDMRATNPPSNDELMTALEQDFIKHNFDVKHLIRTVMNSATYGLSSATNETNAKDDRYYSHFIARRLPAEVILDGLSQVTGVPTKFEGYPAGTRALQLPDSRIDSYFLTVFGRPERLITAESERQQDPTLTQALHVINGKTINEKLRASDGAVEHFTKSNLADAEVIEHLYLAAYSRQPKAEEKAKLTQALAQQSGDARRQMLEDLMWAVLTGREFLFNH
ncbi:MAG: DUF1553 domain-containing protein [Pyrinomonadaceae bacterium]|nr:DUF1553 domain-containing protein [Pyrinomonadaceae bacterium]